MKVVTNVKKKLERQDQGQINGLCNNREKWKAKKVWMKRNLPNCQMTVQKMEG